MAGSNKYYFNALVILRLAKKIRNHNLHDDERTNNILLVVKSQVSKDNGRYIDVQCTSQINTTITPSVDRN